MVQAWCNLQRSRWLFILFHERTHLTYWFMGFRNSSGIAKQMTATTISFRSGDKDTLPFSLEIAIAALNFRVPAVRRADKLAMLNCEGENFYCFFFCLLFAENRKIFIWNERFGYNCSTDSGVSWHITTHSQPHSLEFNFKQMATDFQHFVTHFIPL